MARRPPMSRSENMRRIKGRDTKPEIRLRELLAAVGLVPDGVAPIGRPDLVFGAARGAVFVDGCQWHGCPDHYVRPRTRGEFWAGRLAGAVERDQRQTRELESAGWTVVRVWEHALDERPLEVVERVQAAVSGEGIPWELDLRVARVDVVEGGTDLERRTVVELRGWSATMFQERRRWTGKRGRPPLSQEPGVG